MRVPRLAKAATLVGLSAAPIAVFGLPAHASSTPPDEYWLRTMHVTQAWRGGQGAGITIAVLADGVVANRADIRGSVVSGPDFTRSGRRPGGRYYGVIGTGLASLIVGHGHGKGQGVLGVASHAKVLSVRVTLSPGDPLWSHGQVTSRLPTAIAAGIRYAVKHGATVIDLPTDPGMAGPGEGAIVSAAAGPDPAERAAVAYAVSKGVVLVAPAGDNAESTDAANYPAAYPGVISVGSFGRNFLLAPYSNRQSYVTLTAAGQQVIAASPTGYQTMNSTWAASAIAAGVAVLVRSQFPALSAAQVRSAMIHGTAIRRPGGASAGVGYGTVDAQGAIEQAAAMSPPGANLAMRGALPRLGLPAAPPMPSLGSSIASDLIRDGVISGVALLALLALITWYGSHARRRDRQAILAAELHRRERTRPDQATMLADPLLEYFGPQHAKPAERSSRQPRSAITPRFQPTSHLAGRPPLLQSSRAVRLGLPASATVSDGWASPAGDDEDGAIAGLPVRVVPGDRHGSAFAGDATRPGEATSSGASAFGGGPASPRDLSLSSHPMLPRDPGFARGPVFPPDPSHPRGPAPRDHGFGSAVSSDRDSTVRHASVTGSPPWEPAPEPTTALPWAHPGQQAGGFRLGRQQPDSLGALTGATPSDSGQDDAPARMSVPPRSLFDPGPVARLSAPTPVEEPEPGGGPHDSGGRPIYVWNPASSADAFGQASNERSDWSSIGQSGEPEATS